MTLHDLLMERERVRTLSLMPLRPIDLVHRGSFTGAHNATLHLRGLIRHGWARREGGRYYRTPAGDAWIRGKL